MAPEEPKETMTTMYSANESQAVKVFGTLRFEGANVTRELMVHDAAMLEVTSWLAKHNRVDGPWCSVHDAEMQLDIDCSLTADADMCLQDWLDKVGSAATGGSLHVWQEEYEPNTYVRLHAGGHNEVVQGPFPDRYKWKWNTFSPLQKVTHVAAGLAGLAYLFGPTAYCVVNHTGPFAWFVDVQLWLLPGRRYFPMPAAMLCWLILFAGPPVVLGAVFIGLTTLVKRMRGTQSA